jgi:cellulose synthase/poly-beta-1,6-N-acetylglucosamine synthase-like glycosyltransferase
VTGFLAVVTAFQFLFLLFFLGLNGYYTMLNVLAFPTLVRYMRRRSLNVAPQITPGFLPPITLVVPAYNEEATIGESVRSLLRLDYPHYEVVVVNDGSKDGTIDTLVRELHLVPYPAAYETQLLCKPIRRFYVSTVHPNLRVIDKENGGKSDALNAGINLARTPLFCCMDADSILLRDSLTIAVQPFLEDPTTVCVGGTIRVVNGCTVEDGVLTERRLPKNWLALVQIVEYLRAFLFGRVGWVPLNAVLIISGAFGIFDRKTVIEAGGYRHDTIGEDMELVVRLHRTLREAGRPYRVAFVPDPICWTEVPENLKVLRNQRVRWQRGLGESLQKNRGLLFHRRGGAAGWFAFPVMAVLDLFGPLIELSGYVFMLLCFAMGATLNATMIAFLVLSFGFGIILSASALVLEELSFRVYPGWRAILILFLVAIGAEIGYRQLSCYWRIVGFFKWVRGGQATWGTMTRQAAWKK